MAINFPVFFNILKLISIVQYIFKEHYSLFNAYQLS